MSDTYAALLERIKDIGRLASVEALLEWDQDTFMPLKGVACRAEVVAMAAALKHEWQTDPQIGELLGQLSDTDPDPVRATNIRETRRLYDRAVRVPRELIKEIAHTSALAKDAWAKARQQSDFPAFAPYLSKLLDLKRRQAEHIGYDGEPYDALLAEYEPGASTGQVLRIFAELRKRLVPLVQAIADAPQAPDPSILKRHYPLAAQKEMGRKIAEAIGFDFAAGRMDTSVHPFCTALGCEDVRFTTRYDEHFFPGAVFGVMHEAGHGMYEQGLDSDHAFTPMGSYVSLGIHESQSRLWENLVGRSRPFWERHFRWAQELFPEALRDVTLDQFYAAINAVTPSLIRVEADEVTYNLHIIVRFEIERELLTGGLEVADIPEVWNARMTELVGVTPPNDREGCLQDIHWSMGILGYFPTYALGNLYAAQFHTAAQKAITDLDNRISQGDFRELGEWLRTNVHRPGMRYRPNELCERVTGSPLSIEPFMEYVNEKFRPIYGVS
jgi:carboxypeptidase Taq